jgi:hypothetical protein
MEPDQQQRFTSTVLLILALLVFASLTIFRNAPVFKGIANFFLTFFNWSAYPFALGLVVFALAHLIEGVRGKRFVRWSLVIGLIVMMLLILMESRLIAAHTMQDGVLAELLVMPLLGWTPAVGHIVVLGLLLITIILTFRITFGHVLIVGRFLNRTLVGRVPDIAAEQREEDEYDYAEDTPQTGLRPRFSRFFGSSRNSSEPESVVVQRQSARPVRAGRRPIVADDFDEDADAYNESTVEFDPAFDVDDDPANDINLHKHEISRVRGGARAPLPMDLQEHAQATYGANQQALPFADEIGEEPAKMVLRPAAAMEPLAPNPRKKTPRMRPQPADASSNLQMPNITSLWKLPETTLLHSPDAVKLQRLGQDTTSLARTIQETLRSFRVDAEVRESDISIGPTVVRFGIRPTGKPALVEDSSTNKMVPARDADGNIIYETRTRVSRIMALQNDLALVLEAKSIRMEAPVPGRPYIGVEIPNKNSRLVTLREVLESKEYQAAKSKSRLSMVLGRDVAGLVRVGDLAKMPHLLIAGATGAGKSVMINAIIASFLTQATPDDVRMLMVDPKMVELSLYNGIPHLLSPVVTEVDHVVPLLKNGISEMERRYRLFSQLGVRNLDGYRRMRLERIAKGDTSLNNLPSIVIIIDELADLMMAAPEEVEGMICRLAQLARATGIHLVIATQRPSVDVITGLIKANIPTRISFMVSSAVDSRTIIDMGGAERLLGRGDMLYLPADAGRPERIQGAFLDDDEVEALVGYWRDQVTNFAATTIKDNGADDGVDPALIVPATEPGWEINAEASDEFDLDDELLEKAEDIVRDYGRASISLLQRRLKIGYSRAARLIDLLEEHGIIGQAESGGRGREVLDSMRNDQYRLQDDEGQSIIEEADDIIEEERARDEFLRKQAANQSRRPQTPPDDEDFPEE